MASSLSPLGPTDLLDLRQNYIRDQWKDSPTFQGLSRFNESLKRNFFTDAQLSSIDARMSIEWEDELVALWSDKHAQQLNQNDSETEASTDADALQLDARKRLIRSECWQVQMNDPSFRASLVVDRVNLAPALFAQWTEQIKQDRAFVRGRSGTFGSILIERR